MTSKYIHRINIQRRLKLKHELFDKWINWKIPKFHLNPNYGTFSCSYIENPISILEDSNKRIKMEKLVIPREIYNEYSEYKGENNG